MPSVAKQSNNLLVAMQHSPSSRTVQAPFNAYSSPESDAVSMLLCTASLSKVPGMPLHCSVFCVSNAKGKPHSSS